METPVVKLKVMEAVQDDVNKGIVKIDSSFMKKIGVNPGDIIELSGERKTAAIVDRAYPGDIGLNIIRMDGNIRRNARTSIGEMVGVKKAEVKPARKIVIAPANKGVMIKASPELFKQGLLGKALMKGDIVSLGRTRRRVDIHGREMTSVFDMMESQFAGFAFGDIKFVVVETNPKKEIVTIGPSTQVEFNPHAVEIAEEEGISLGINYEDIGGLQEEITKVREMIELPLKHPEIFEKLGIEPPKGVLLHGPPGTGKTLLAKAVASETNSHFILINGPEVISKFYGESLPYDESVLVVKNGFRQRMKIGEIVEGNHKDVEVICFDTDGNVVLKKVDDLIAHKRTRQVYKVTTKSGRIIRVTGDHSLFTLGSNGIEEIKTNDLIPNQSYVAIPASLPFAHEPIYSLNLLELLRENDYGLKVKNGHHYLAHAKQKLGIEECARVLGIRQKYFYDVLSKKVGVGVKVFSELMHKASIDVNPRELQIGTKRSYVPAYFQVSEKLAEFFGWWIAEGSYSKDRSIRLSIHKDEFAYLSELCMQLFGQCGVYYKKGTKAADIFIHSKALQIVMQNVLGFIPGSSQKRVPALVYSLDKARMAAFLRGYFSGDGSVNRHGSAPQVEVASSSHELINDIAYLLLHFGIVSKIYDKKVEKAKRLTFASYHNLEKFREIGFVCPQRNLFIAHYCREQTFSREKQVPIVGQIKQEIESNSRLSAWKESKSIGVSVLQKYAPELNLNFGDITFDLVKEVEVEKHQPETVYDISVPNHHNFVAGYGGIFAHNSEANLRKKFEEAEQNAPSIIFFDEIDAIATKREETKGDVEKRVVAQLLGLMDGLKSRGKVIVIAATNMPNSLDPALRRPGRFDREIELGVPSKDGREEILKIHTRNMPLAKGVNLKDIAKVTHGFVGADLNALAKEAAMIVLRRILPDLKVEGIEEGQSIPTEILEKIMITQKDFMESLKIVRPSAMREVLVETPDVGWKDIGGLEEVKGKLREAVEWPLKKPEMFTRMGIRPPRGILLYGPPGTGKTLLAKAVAKESEANFILVNGPSLLSKWVGESEKAVREIFRKARQTSPTILFFDEIDSLVPRRGAGGDSHVSERVVNQMLTEMDGLESLNDVVIVGATNRPELVDPALLRQGRFDRLILTPSPDEEGRKAIFEIYLKEMPIAKDVNAKELAGKTEGYVGADIEGVCREAAMIALRDNTGAKEVTMEHFTAALKVVRASIDEETEKTYAQLESYFSSARAKEIQEDKDTYFG